MTDEQFESLWQRAEAENYGNRLSAGYPAWRHRQRRTFGMAAMFMVVVAVVLPLALRQPSPKGYGRVYCNRTGIADSRWADMAADILIIPTI